MCSTVGPEERTAKHLLYTQVKLSTYYFLYSYSKFMTNKTECLRWPNRLKASATVCVLNQAFIRADHKLHIPNMVSIIEFLVVLEIMCKLINS